MLKRLALGLQKKSLLPEIETEIRLTRSGRTNAEADLCKRSSFVQIAKKGG